MFVCNYTNRSIEVPDLGERLQPGPNFFPDNHAQEIMARMESSDAKDHIALVEDLEDVEWGRVPEPWRSAYYRAYGDRIFRKARMRELKERDRAFGDSIKKMNRSVGAQRETKPWPKAAKRVKKAAA